MEGGILVQTIMPRAPIAQRWKIESRTGAIYLEDDGIRNAPFTGMDRNLKASNTGLRAMNMTKRRALRLMIQLKLSTIRV
jgi:hypothetical protein